MKTLAATLAAALLFGCHGAESPTDPAGGAAALRVAGTGYDDGGAIMRPQTIFMPIGGPTQVTVSLRFPPAALDWTIYCAEPAIATCSAVIPAGQTSTTMMIYGHTTGRTEVWYSVPNFGHAPSSSAIGSVNVIIVDPPPPHCTAPAINAATGNQTIRVGESAWLGIFTEGTPLTYRWTAVEWNTAPHDLPGANSPFLNTGPLTRTTTFTATVTNECGSARSWPMTVTVNLPLPRAARH